MWKNYGQYSSVQTMVPFHEATVMKNRIILSLLVIGILVGVGATVGSLVTASPVIAGCSGKC
jgi:hypothetical protein